MRHRLLDVGLLGLVALLGVSQANAAIDVDVKFTADNVVAAFYKDGGAWETVTGITGNLSDWRTTKSKTLALEAGHIYQLIFRVYNLPSPSNGNPAGFLAQIGGTSGVLSGADWQYAVDRQWTNNLPDVLPNDFDFNTDLAWNSAHAWAIGGTSSYNGGNNIWRSVKGGPISGISTNAQWIWGEYNAAGLIAHPEEQRIWVRAFFEVDRQGNVEAVVPEPATLAVWSLLGLSGAGMWMVRRRRAGGRAAWSDENRAAIHQLVGRSRV